MRITSCCIVWVLTLGVAGCAGDEVGGGVADPGRTRQRIVGGQAAAPGQFPFMVSVQLRSLTGSSGASGSVHHCGGALLDARWVVTAAHCVDGYSANDLRVYAGSLHRTIGPLPDGRVVNVKAVFSHPDYSAPSTYDKDIALLQLVQPLPLEGSQGRLGVVALPSQGEETPADTSVTLVGWGATLEGGSLSSLLRYVQAPIVSREDCNVAYGAGHVTDTMLCAAVPEGGRSTCTGDGGGPLVAYGAGGTPRLVGVTSWAAGCARKGYPSVFTQVSSFTEWIHQILP